MDAVANVILDVTFSSETHAALNVVNPRPTEWDTIMGAIGDSLAREVTLGRPLPLVPFKDWFSSLDHSAKTLSLEDQKQFVSSIPFFLQKIRCSH